MVILGKKPIKYRNAYISLCTGDLPDYILKANIVGIDIETNGLDARNHVIKSIQVYGRYKFEEMNYDHVIILRDFDILPKRLKYLLEEAKIMKIFHHAPFDLEFIMRTWGIIPQNVVCTKVAAKLLDPKREKSKHSLKDLLLHYLGIDLEKAMALSDWGAKELTQKQIEYAADDVLHLPLLLKTIEQGLRKEKKIKKAKELYKELVPYIVKKIKEVPNTLENQYFRY